VAAVIIVGIQPASGSSSTYTIRIASASPGGERVVSIGSWYELSDSAGWTFRPETDIDHVELALYDSTTALAAGTTPFEQRRTRTSGLWPDGPENELGELGYEVSPNVLGDNNQHLYGKPHYRSIRLYGGQLSSDSVYEVSFADSAPSRIWLHPLRSHYFTMSADILQSSESTLTNPVYGPASVSRTILNADSTRFEYSGLSPDVATGLKDDYPVGDYGQRPGSHGHGDFGWFPGYALSFYNEGPVSVVVALFVTTGFTGPSGAPPNTLANDTFWRSDGIFIPVGDTATVEWDFDNVQGYSLSDNPFPHTAGDQSVPDGTAGVAVNIFDRLQVSAIGWEVRSGVGGPADASLIIAPGTATVDQETQTNVICVPDCEHLTSSVPTKSVEIEYLGGGSGLVCGYDLTFSWNDAVVSTSTAAVAEGTLLSSEGTTLFFVTDTSTPGHPEITVDCVLTGTSPGAAGPGTMFTIGFTGIAFGSSPIDVTVVRVRDRNNQDLTGFLEDDGLLIVDVSSPTISSVDIDNPSLAHTDDYIKDGDTAIVTAEVTDDDPSFGIGNITADLSGLGGGVSVNPDTYVGTTATWTLPSVTCSPANGTVTVTVSALDALGNPADPGSDDIIADNTAPTAVTDFDASPGHEECGLTWTMGTDSHLAGVTVRRVAGGEYPTYGTFVGDWPDVLGHYPPGHAAGTEVYNGSGTSHTDGVVARDIYFYQAFCYDEARNYGPSASTARDFATNYWLGDVADGWLSWGYDALVDMDDVEFLSHMYTLPPTGSYRECDVGPTAHPDGSGAGVPLPDNLLDFEDLMIFGLNYGLVGPRVVPYLPLPETTQELALSVEERSMSASGEVELSLVLSGNVDEVKGLSGVFKYDMAELEFVSARLSAEMSSPLGDLFFWHGCEDGRIQVDLVVLGTDITVGGSGEVAVLTFAVLSDEYGAEIESADLRGTENRPLDADLEDFESNLELPLVFHLGQNVPNPFNPVTKIAYHVPHESDVTIRVYDVAGRVVTALLDGVVPPGRHQAMWNGLDDQGEAVGGGVYFCAMEAPGFRECRKITLLK
jgi:hypothetical protein